MSFELENLMFYNSFVGTVTLGIMFLMMFMILASKLYGARVSLNYAKRVAEMRTKMLK